MKASTNTCRVCYEEEEDITKLTSPCGCKGSMQYIHIRCLRLMKKEPQYKHQCPTCKLPWKQIVLPGSSVEHAIDLTSSGDIKGRHIVFSDVNLDIEPEEGVAHTMRWGRGGGSIARRFGKTYI